MAEVLETTELKREFRYDKNGKKIILEDFNPMCFPEEVIKFYSGQYPELTNLRVEAPKFEADKMIFNVSSSLGTKG